MRRSNRQRRPPVHLSEDDYPASDAEPASDDDKAARMARKLHAFPGVLNWGGAQSDDSDQSCYGDFPLRSKHGMPLCMGPAFARMLTSWHNTCFPLCTWHWSRRCTAHGSVAHLT